MVRRALGKECGSHPQGLGHLCLQYMLPGWVLERGLLMDLSFLSWNSSTELLEVTHSI